MRQLVKVHVLVRARKSGCWVRTWRERKTECGWSRRMREAFCKRIVALLWARAGLCEEEEKGGWNVVMTAAAATVSAVEERGL